MSLFTANKLRETRNRANFSQAEAATAMKMSERKLRLIEANEHPVSVDDILEFSKLYKVDVRELIIEFYQDFGEEQILCNRYASFLKLFDQLTDREKEDVIWVIKQRIAGRL
jgi:transcriptional regulator with XRE-family HTH domain